MTAVFFILLWLYATVNRRLVTRDLEPYLLRTMTRRYLLGTVAYLFVFLLAFVNVAASLALIVALALLFVLPEPGERTSKKRAPPVRGSDVRWRTGKSRDLRRSPPPPPAFHIASF